MAIARAIVKKPRIILADEPTGNLDTHTARAIVELLKELSRDCLILIVSHNVNDANSYADRIIELKKGEIISDKSRNPDFADCVTLQDGMLVYPKDTYLIDGDIELMNNNKSAQIIKRRDKFVATPESKIKTTNIKIERKTLSLGKELGLSGRFLKNKSLVISLSAFMVAVIMTILALAQTIAAFDGGHIIADEMAKENQSSLLLNKVLDERAKAELDGNYRVEIGENDLQTLYDAGYGGKIYPVYNVTVNITSHSNFATKTINDKMHEIGILKAIGTKNGTIGVVFGLQVMLIAILTCGLSTLGYYLFIDMANDILIESIRRIAPGWNLPELQFLVFEWEIALMNCALTLGLALVSLIAPMIKIKAIKPVKIIKAKE